MYLICSARYCIDSTLTHTVLSEEMATELRRLRRGTYTPPEEVEAYRNDLRLRATHIKQAA